MLSSYIVYSIADKGSPEAARSCWKNYVWIIRMSMLLPLHAAAKKGDYQTSKALYLKAGAEEYKMNTMP